MDIKEIGKYIRFYRNKRNMSQRELAAAIGKSDSTIGGYEKGDGDIPLSAILAMAEALEIAPERLLGAEGTDDDFKPDATLRIFAQEDRKNIAGILTMNGYTVRQVKVQRENKKSSWYCIQAMLDERNMGSQ